MDQKGNYIIEIANETQNYFLRKTLQFLVPIFIISFLVSHFSGFPSSFRDLQFSTMTFSLFAQALDRKCMFLICNGILAFLAKNLKLTASGLKYDGFTKSTAEDGVTQIPELPQISVVQENAASMEYVDTPLDVAASQEKQIAQQQELDYGSSQKEAEEIKTRIVILESDDWGEEEEEKEEEEEEEEEHHEESGNLENTSLKEELSDSRVSTEELNKKFEEFIRRMKEEIRIEAQQQYMIAV